MTSREVDGAAVLALHGRIVLGDGHRALCDKLKNLISEGKKKIVLNMNHIEHIDGIPVSSGGNGTEDDAIETGLTEDNCKEWGYVDFNGAI